MRLPSPAKLRVFSFLESTAKSKVAVLGDDEVHAWVALPALFTPQLEECVRLLSADELERMSRFRFQEHQQNFLFSRSMLRILLGTYLHVAPELLHFSYSVLGKPDLALPFAAADLRFNLSHSNGAALLAICKGRRIGADIEKMREDFDPEEISTKFFSIQERHALMSLAEGARREAFFRCWTRKEALLKAKGGGLSLPLDLFDVSIGDESAVTLVTRPDPEEAEQWEILSVPVPSGYSAAIAVGKLPLK